MTLTEIQFDKPPTKRHAIFIAAGDKETFASYALQNLAAYFDILIFFYGDDAKVRAGLERNARFLAVGSATKFNALKSLDAASGIVVRYRTIWVCDDDIVLCAGDPRRLPHILATFHLKVLSPVHSPAGKVSHAIMRAQAGPHAFRFVNFVEMTCPLFDAWSLSSFLHAYDGSLDGMGLDWWYMAFLESETRRNAAMVDGITILNPDNRQKNQDIREIDKFNSCGERERQWLYAQSRYPHDLQYSVAPREQHTFEYSHADRRRGFVFIWKIFTGVLKAALSPFRHFSRDECAAG